MQNYIEAISEKRFGKKDEPISSLTQHTPFILYTTLCTGTGQDKTRQKWSVKVNCLLWAIHWAGLLFIIKLCTTMYYEQCQCCFNTFGFATILLLDFPIEYFVKSACSCCRKQNTVYQFIIVTLKNCEFGILDQLREF